MFLYILLFCVNYFNIDHEKCVVTYFYLYIDVLYRKRCLQFPACVRAIWIWNTYINSIYFMWQAVLIFSAPEKLQFRYCLFIWNLRIGFCLILKNLLKWNAHIKNYFISIFPKIFMYLYNFIFLCLDQSIFKIKFFSFLKKLFV